MNNWINVNDRLPKIDVDVLVYYTFGTDHKYESIEIGHIDYITETSSGRHPSWNNSNNPTHWQPLPDKPKTA